MKYRFEVLIKIKAPLLGAKPGETDRVVRLGTVTVVADSKEEAGKEAAKIAKDTWPKHEVLQLTSVEQI